jgi:hypothetical protein
MVLVKSLINTLYVLDPVCAVANVPDGTAPSAGSGSSSEDTTFK